MLEVMDKVGYIQTSFRKADISQPNIHSAAGRFEHAAWKRNHELVTLEAALRQNGEGW